MAEAQQWNQEPGRSAYEGIHFQRVLDDMERVYASFQQAFRWNDDTTNQLFDRIAGAAGPLSTDFQDHLLDLYLKAQESAFVQDEKRAVYRRIFGAFAREAKDTTMIRAELVERHDIDEAADELYVTKHLLLIIERLSMHEE